MPKPGSPAEETGLASLLDLGWAAADVSIHPKGDEAGAAGPEGGTSVVTLLSATLPRMILPPTSLHVCKDLLVF